MTITIESGHEMPHGREVPTSKLGAIRATLAKMKLGQSFVWGENKHVYTAARQIGVKIKTEKLNGEGFRVWRAQ